MSRKNFNNLEKRNRKKNDPKISTLQKRVLPHRVKYTGKRLNKPVDNKKIKKI
jgi:hypothetical protein